MSVRVVVVNGRPSSGKSFFEETCMKLTALHPTSIGWDENDDIWVGIYSTVDLVKDVAKCAGWNEEKTPKNRKFLSDLKKLLTDWDDVPFREVRLRANRMAKDSGDWVFFVDCREPNEIQRLKEAFNATTVLIRRAGDEIVETSNQSDNNVFDYNYDLTIWNNFDIMDLQEKAKDFMRYMKGAPQYEYGN